MNKVLKVIVSFVFLISTLTACSMKPEKDYLDGITHLGNATLMVEKEEKIIYFDPFTIKGEPKDADIIFITHSHDDHYSMKEIEKVMKEDTTFVVTQDVAGFLKNKGISKIVEVTPEGKYEVEGIEVETVPAYNIDKSYHKKEKNWVGYIVNLNDVRYYIAGDTDIIPEMESIQSDVAFLPVGGTYTMTAEEAAKAANMIKPKVAVPIHYGAVAGALKDAETFVEKLEEPINGKILQDEKK